MATSLPIRSALKPATPSTSIDSEQAAQIEQWTEQATEALGSVSLSLGAGATPRPVRGTSVTVSIPLDGAEHIPIGDEQVQDTRRLKQRATTNNAYGRREIIRRDSLKRREALLKGKEGSRQRRRWENDRLLNNPWVEPPLPTDWEVRPTNRHQTVPYYLAPLWDEERTQKKKSEQRRRRFHGSDPESTDPATHVPKEVRARLKRARAAKGLLQDLEEDVRLFIEKWNNKQAERHEDGLGDIDSEEDEVVFVGRNGSMHDSPNRRKVDADVRREKLVFDTLAEDRNAGFGRWLVHSIATYYGLKTWSVTVGDPARREAYVGIAEDSIRQSHVSTSLPRPLWGMV